jgi:poly(hydroxyalkanoate) depolymerase family esterase
MRSRLIIFTLFLFQFLFIFPQSDLVQIRPFGTNPGNLKLMFYDPGNITGKAPLVVVLHGCTQTAGSCAEQTGWNKLAKLNGFFVLYPEQLILNNPENCFNWYRSGDQQKDKGEPASILQMIDYLKKNKSIDSTRIYVIGLSAGGAMSSILMAVSPQVFDKGGVMSGGPYKSAESVLKAGPAMLGMVSKSPEDWGNLIKEQNPNYTGSYPELIAFHGGADPVVSSNNANQLMKQWTNIHHTDYEADEHDEAFKGNEAIERSVYKDQAGNEVATYYRIKGMGHAVALDTGNCRNQGGKTGLFAVDRDFHSSWWAARFFGILKEEYHIAGDTLVKAGQSGLSYSVPLHENAYYNWKTPAGMWITSGDKSHAIVVSADYESGYLELTETRQDGCRYEAPRVWIKVRE